MDKGTKIKAYSAGVFFAILVGFSFLAVRVTVQTAAPIEVLVFRFNFAFLMVCITALFFKFARPNVKARRKALACVGAFYIGFMFLLTIGLVFSTSIESAIMFAIVPIIAKIVARILLKETSTWQQNVFVGMSVSAVIFMIIMSAGDIEVNLLGLILLMLSSLLLALSNVLFRYIRKEHNQFSLAFANSTLGCIVFNVGYIFYLFNTHGSIVTYFAPCVNINFVLATAYLGIPCNVFTVWAMGYMMQHFEALRATIFGNLASVISIFVGLIILGEPMPFYNIICAVVIIGGVVGVSKFAKT